uniref:Lipoprotein n=1 Tax=Geobacter metallireducens TaxID=28232 RepID=A0A831XCV7_GEOME
MNTNTYRHALIALVLAAGAALPLAGCDNAKAFSVNDVASDPAAYTGSITLTGIMGGTSRMDPKVFGIMDLKELQCTTPGCSKVFIPIRTNGQMPALGDEVRVTGSFRQEPGGYIFVAEKLKVVKNHKLGG